MNVQEYPKWVKVDGPGHPQHPGHVLVESEDQEREVLAGGEAPRDLNPPHSEEAEEEGPKAVTDMSREELIAEIVKESITDDVSDDQLRDTLNGLRHRSALDRADEGEGGPDPDKLTDAEGNEVPPDVADEANKGSEADATRTAPQAAPEPETDTRPENAKAKEADDHPATDQTDAALTPPDQPKPRRKAHAAPKGDDHE